MSEQLNRIEAKIDNFQRNQESITTLLADLIGKVANVKTDTTDIKKELTEFRHDSQREFKTLSRRVNALEVDLSETQMEIESFKRAPL